MTTRLDGRRTRVPAVQPRARRPAARATRPNPDGHATALPVGGGLAARRLARHPRPLHPRRARRGPTASGEPSRLVIFPRYHQWDAVRRLEAHARARRRRARPTSSSTRPARASRNTIAWLAHRLSTLHDADDKTVFDKVVVITDRRRPRPPAAGDDLPVRARARRRRADRPGLRSSSPRRWPASRRGSSSRRCRSSRSSSTRSRELGRRRYAVIVDEAHSSQTGEAAKDLQGGARRRRPRRRSSRPPRARTRPRRRPTRRTRSPRPSRPAAGSRTCRSSPSPRRRRPGRWSCSARKNADGDATRRSTSTRCARRSRRASSSTCSRTTRPTRPTGRSSKADRRRPRVRHGARRGARSRASSRCTRTTWRRRPRSSSSTSATHTAPQDRRPGQGDGRHPLAGCTRSATSRRSTATSPRRATTDIAGAGRVLRARSIDDRRSTYTEPGMNGVPGDARPPSEFDEPTSYQVLIVAEKYQTGFDQPLLHTMYVDKKLDGRQRRADPVAAQPHPPRQDRHVRPRLPQRRRGHPEAFEPFYERDDRRADRPEPALRPADRASTRSSVIDRRRGARAAAIIVRTAASRPTNGTVQPCSPRPSSAMPRCGRRAREGPRRARPVVRSYAFLSQIVAVRRVELESSTPTAASSRCGCRASSLPASTCPTMSS